MFRTELVRPVHEFLVEHARNAGDKIAFSDDVRGVSYADLELRTRRLAGHLSALSLEPGDRAAIYLGNRVETVESYLAITRASAIGTPFNPHSTDAELGHLLDDSGARVVITDTGRAEQVRRVLGGDAEAWIVVVGDTEAVRTGVRQRVVPFEVLAGSDPGVPARDDLGLDEPAWMLYTSGTTGRPKGVLSTQRNCLWSVAACYVPIPGLSRDDRVVWPLPLFHSLAHIFCVLGVTSVGAGARIVSDASAEAVLDVLEDGSFTFLAGVPTLYHNLLREIRHSGRTVPALRMCLVGGAVTGAQLRRDVEETLGAPLIDAYGSTETCGSITVNRPDGERVEGSCGLPVPGLDVRLVDRHTGQDADTGQEGEVWVSGPNVMLGYHNQPEATRAALRDGWYRTGDLAVRDASGHFRITGRVRELIIRGGENLHPGEVEQVLREVRGVRDAAVVGRPHETLGEVPVAFVVPDAHGVEPEKLFAACREKLSYFKVPEELYEVDSIPRTTSGKIIRHRVPERPALLRAAGSGEYDALFRTDWIPLTHPGPAAPAAAPAAGDCAVVGTGAAQLRALGTGGTGPRAYADFAALSAAVAAGDPVPGLVARLVDTAAGDPGAALRAAEELSREVRGWLADERCAAARLAVVTRGAVSTGPGQVPDLAQAAAWGAMSSLTGLSEGRVAVADVDFEPGSAAALPAAVSRGEPQLAIRSGIALAPKLARVTAATDGTRYAAPDPYRSVVLTGAGSPAAAAVARHLVTVHGTREMLLISPDGEGDPAAADLLDRLAALGAAVELAACDPADRGALEAALAGRGPSAVLHFPGRAEAVGAETAGDELRRVLTGAVQLHELMAGPGPFVLFSSLAGTLGAAAEPARGAVAAMLDALAVQRQAAGRPALALAYGPPWGGPADGAPSGVGTLSDRRALAMFDAAHTVHDPLLASFVLDPDAPGDDVPAPLGPLAGPRPVRPDEADEADEAAAAELREWLAGLSGKERSRELVGLVVRETSRLRPGAAVDAARPFRDLGLTSVASVGLCRRLTAATGLTLPTTLAFDHPTPTAVAELLRTRLFGEDGPAPAPTAPKPTADEPIAIVSMGCRLPGGVSSPEDLWRLVESGADAVSRFPDDRGWPLDELFGSGGAAPLSSTRQAAFLDDVAGFDASLFAVSPREAQAMDPQQRLLLEVAWEVFERAAVDPMSLRGEKVGVFTGLMHHDYAGGDTAQHQGHEGHRGVGKAGSVASGRIAYTFGLEGPAVTVDTACSSSLVSMHLAAQSLRGGDCDLALAGGVAVMATPTTFIEFSQQGALAADGRCKAFADAADGTGWSEGVGLVLLERLSDARARGHRVLAVVRGSAVNQDGASNGLTAPSGPSQERVIRGALASAGLAAGEVDAVEAHGTGTSLGDPIEANALLATYGQERDPERPLWLGSVKSNVGHTQAAAGVTGVIKMVQAMRHGRLPRTLHVDRPSSHVDWSAGSVELLTEATAWPEVERPRRAGVSSFGVSGTNAHVILEQPPGAPAAPDGEGDGDAAGDGAGGRSVPWVVSGQSGA
ncbi:beta-ketoacyl synthase N-terminal-like domain-containing protein, partial [Streptomyces boncukensis]